MHFPFFFFKLKPSIKKPKLLVVSATRRPSVRHRGCADFATHAVLWPRGGRGPAADRLAQQTKASGQGASSLAQPLQPLLGASPPTGSDQATQQETAR
eukprot:COSAG06_NODE_594_length_13939_cov_45.080202_18_plen_98_part_00